MATVNLYVPFDLTTADFLDGKVTSITSTEIRISDGPRKVVITGTDFEYSNGVLTGTIHGVEQTFKGSLEYSTTGLDLDAHYAYELYKAGRIEELLEVAFEDADVMNGSSGNDTLAGFGGNDKIWGGAGADLVYGGEAGDHLFGNAGADQMYGGAGNDRMIGGLGQDTLTGGEGADTFVFRSLDEVSGDVITDFASGEDKIDLRQIDADSTAVDDQAFTFIGAAAFGSNPGELRYDSGSGILSGDVDGDGLADFEIELTGSPTLTVDDFFL